MGEPEQTVKAVGVNIPALDQNGPQIADSKSFLDVYDEERDKRIREDGVRQYLNPAESEKFQHFLEDPFVETGTPIQHPVPDGGHTKVLIIGAGFGGILIAVRLLQAGFKVEDLLIVDPAGGFGGTVSFKSVRRLRDCTN